MTKNLLTPVVILLSVIVLSKVNSCSFPGAKEDPALSSVDHRKFYQPGIGFFMGRIQTFHEKLGLSINGKNVDLANFYIHELEESIEDLTEMHEGRKETQLIHSLIPPIELIEDALESKDFVAAKDAYLQLTNSCNACHKSLDFEFIVIKTPTENRFTTQDFEKESSDGK